MDILLDRIFLSIRYWQRLRRTLISTTEADRHWRGKARWEQLLSKNTGIIDAEMVKKMEGDTYDFIRRQDGSNERSLCGSVELSERGIPEWDLGKFIRRHGASQGH